MKLPELKRLEFKKLVELFTVAQFDTKKARQKMGGMLSNFKRKKDVIGFEKYKTLQKNFLNGR